MNQLWNYNHCWLTKFDFVFPSTMVTLLPMSLSLSSFEKRGEGGVWGGEGGAFLSLLLNKDTRTVLSFMWNFGPINKAFLEIFLTNRSLKFLRVDIISVFDSCSMVAFESQTFTKIIIYIFFCKKNLIKTKHSFV